MPVTPVDINPVALAAREGLSSRQKTLPPWLFYDELGSLLFEQITELPEYYLTRTERALFVAHADEILQAMGGEVTVAELGAGSAAKTGVLLGAALRRQTRVLYQPIDVSPSALEAAAENLEQSLPGVDVHTQLRNYITEPYGLERPRGTCVLALYIGSSIGNFSPEEAHGILRRLRAQLQPGDALLLGSDLAPGPHKPVSVLLAAYNDAAGVTAAFNRNILQHLNRILDANFQVDRFTHEARWNQAESRMEMHLCSLGSQQVLLPADAAHPELRLSFRDGETIHTENSYKFSQDGIRAMLRAAGFAPHRTFCDAGQLFAVTLAFAG